MKIFFRLLFIPAVVISAASCSVSKNPQRKIIHDLVKGKTTEDTSFVYHLPYNAGDKHLLVQGYFSRFTHKESAALDFKMKRGTKISAARGGVVIRAKGDGNRGGWNKKYRPDANIIVIQHEDGTKAGYWHLQHNSLLVKLGDTVKQDQPIALSGRTGYAFGPHLHFIVWRNDSPGTRKTLATRFKTKSGDKYLKPLHAYRKV
jgi:hypothetical protein